MNKICLLALITLSFTSLSFADTCARISGPNLPGFLGEGVSSTKTKVENFMLKNFDMILLGSEVDASLPDSCESIPVNYSCNTTDSCSQFCIASSVTESGAHMNVVYKVNQCPGNQLIEVVDKAIVL